MNIKDKFIGNEEITVEKLNSNNATSGQVPTADGSGGVTWEDQLSAPQSPTFQIFTSGSGTYNTPLNVKYIIVKMVGGGGGGGGAGTGSASSGGVGSNTTFGTSLLIAHNGNGGGIGGGVGGNGAGGGITINSPAVDIGSMIGSNGQIQGFMRDANSGAPPPAHGASSFFGGGGGTTYAGNGLVGRVNSGSGGGGGALTTTSTADNYGGGGGGAGGYVNAIIYSPNASYSYSVGSGGSAGVAGTLGGAGGAGASGIIIVEEYY